MAEYIQNKTEVVNLGEKIIFNNQCKNPIEVGTGLIFREDGTYIVSVYNGKITVYESGTPHEKLKEEETEPYKLYINACDPVNKKFIGYRCNKCDADINLFFNHYCPNCGRKINWEAIKDDNK